MLRISAQSESHDLPFRNGNLDIALEGATQKQLVDQHRRVRGAIGRRELVDEFVRRDEFQHDLLDGLFSALKAVEDVCITVLVCLAVQDFSKHLARESRSILVRISFRHDPTQNLVQLRFQ